MFHKTKMKILFVAMLIIFSIPFYFGIFANPHFNIYDFCMNLTSEVLGLIIAVAIVDAYIREKNK